MGKSALRAKREERLDRFCKAGLPVWLLARAYNLLTEAGGGSPEQEVELVRAHPGFAKELLRAKKQRMLESLGLCASEAGTSGDFCGKETVELGFCAEHLAEVEKMCEEQDQWERENPELVAAANAETAK